MTTPPPPLARRVSPLDAVGEAIDHAKRNLFPFRFDRWLALGFVAFLDQCGRGGAGTFRVPSPGGGGGSETDRNAATNALPLAAAPRSAPQATRRNPASLLACLLVS
jgi:hypothetical protein